ncbi:ATP-dependent helicase [Agrobacterium sp.]|jgi:DNA helicase-2/ATP-dependent DNA helicase PcrA|uniref:ATP-dependent helicase n=1 Tax=Agrobacterium sp. TaxID=361 RepID=UPI0028AE93D3
MPLELTDGQKAVLDSGGYMLVRGGPGSGKTTVSILKAAELTVGLRSTQRVLFLSFARATVARILEAIAEEETLTVEKRRAIAVDTYHSFFWDLLKTHGYLCGWPRRLTVLPPPAEAAVVSDITSEYKALSGLSTEVKAERRGRIRAELERVAHVEGRVCFDLFAPTVATLLESSKKLRQLVSAKYPFIVLDEFQDTNVDQWRVVKALGEFSTLIALADPEQRIFDFIGADPERLDHFVQAFNPTLFDLAGDNHRSKGTDIALFGNDILRGKYSQDSYDCIDCDTFPPVDMPAMVKLKATVLAARKRLQDNGNAAWSMAILVPTKKLTRLVSDSLQVRTGKLPPIPHEAAIELDAAILGAEAIAFLMQPDIDGSHCDEFISLVAAFFRGRNGSEASKTGIGEATSIRKAYDKAKERAARGLLPTANSIIVPLMKVYDDCRALTLTGDPDADWRNIRNVLESGACTRLKEIGSETRNIRLLGRGSQLRQALSEDRLTDGTYRNALAIVRTAFIQEHFSNRAKPEHGISVMNMHKAKGKQFDEVIIFEGFPRRLRGEIVSNADRIVRSNLRQHAGAEARQNFRVSITRAKQRTTILTPAGDICVLLVPEEDA